MPANERPLKNNKLPIKDPEDTETVRSVEVALWALQHTLHKYKSTSSLSAIRGRGGGEREISRNIVAAANRREPELVSAGVPTAATTDPATLWPAPLAPGSVPCVFFRQTAVTPLRRHASLVMCLLYHVNTVAYGCERCGRCGRITYVTVRRGPRVPSGDDEAAEWRVDIGAVGVAGARLQI
ncbi:hypothetical protein SPI_00775 [Niveomyces insectorum RCEF 264]|uniref:Uncharacterized protein n=1 Tax=Niveomyces insectorum RCEF 264 TaxID=1081102 RepID=A0A168ACY9_9HYPO|nr:hypothetical protein SPI_00775 [Niveomyces insectorum RCEF 264]